MADISHAYAMEPIVIFDLSRTQADKIDHVYCIWPRFRPGAVQKANEKKSKTKKVSSRGHELQRSVGRMRDVQQLRYAWRQTELIAPGAIGDARANPFRAQPARAHAAHSRL